MPVTCIVVGCGSRSNRDIVKFFTVPTILTHRFLLKKNELSEKRRILWLTAIGRSDLTESKIINQRVCSKHFITGEPAPLENVDHPDWIPTQNMGPSYPSLQRALKRGKDEDAARENEEVHKRIKTELPEVECDVKLSIEEYQENKMQQTNFAFRGLMAPVFTIFNKDWSLNTELIPKYAKFLAGKGIPAVLVHGSTGEGMSLSVAERKVATEAWVAAAKSNKLHVMIQVGGCPLPDVLELAKHAEKIGADSLLCLPELYIKPKTPQELIDYLKLVAGAAPNTALLYYHVPMWSEVYINMEAFLELSIGQIPTFSGIKYTSNDLSEGYNALKAANGRYAVFLGADTLVQPALALGFDSVIATCINFLPEHFVKIAAYVQENRIKDARAIQEKITAACKVITKDGTWIPTMKVAMNFLTPINVGLARAPLKNLTDEQVKTMQAKVKAHASL